jgi:D-alanyl-D-alanine carboxypeptidase
LIAAVALKNDIFRQIVSTKEYEAVIKNERCGLSRKLSWKNTNKLLWKEWQGVKTGTTETAGHCFIGKYQDYLISVFDCATMNKRFTDAERLVEWLTVEKLR